MNFNLKFGVNMKENEIGRMMEVEVRKMWRRESQDFSDWLAKEENISYLNDILGLTLTDIQREVYVGPYHCDLFAKDESSDVKVVIENQLDKTDHDHLGKIITYAAGLKASVLVWIVGKALDEHKAAVEWLNNNTDIKVNFFLIELHAYKIGESKPAPKFEPVIVPNDFIKNGRSSSSGNNMTKGQSEALIFWERFNEILVQKGKPFNKRSAQAQHWYEVSIGTSKAHISIELLNSENKISLNIYIPDNKDYYDALFSYKDDIEKEFGDKFNWDRLDSKKASRIRYFLPNLILNFDDHSNYDQLIEETIRATAKLKKVLEKYVKKIGNN